MTNTELVLNMLAEVAEEGAQTAKAARLQLEKSTGQPVVSRLNAKKLSGRGLELKEESPRKKKEGDR
jgi:hypothetical protein